MSSNRSMPPGDVIPELGYPDVPAAAAWLCRAFGFRERLRIGQHRAQLRVGNGSIVVVAAPPGTAAASTHAVMVRVADVDAHCAQARQAGAHVLGDPTTFPYGERQYAAEDLGGHRWIFSQSVADLHPREWGGEWLDDDDVANP